MSTMPNLINFSLDSANIALSALNVTPSLIFQATAFNSSGIVIAQSPSGGSTISGPVTLTLTGIFKNNGATIFSQPANYVQPITSPG